MTTGSPDAGRERGPVASVARMYDYYLGGNDHLPVDQAAAEEVIERMPLIRLMARSNRAFLQRAVRFLVDAGVRQFLDIGSGLPTMGNTHEVAQALAPDARVLYVDVEPVAVLHGRRLLEGNDLVGMLQGDIRQPASILEQIESPEYASVIDLGEPVALILTSVLLWVRDDNEAFGAVRAMTRSLPPGSWLVISHGAVGGVDTEVADAVADVYQRRSAAVGRRTRDQIMEFFAGFELVEPGLVWLPQWRPGPDDSSDFEQPNQSGALAGVAFK
ncbi:SAM-dependent methyltransferase [Phytohabitans maris]|uniref:SAM-dependent methyltransferase n=1 Tax=Phytohabitans maris TaxID=3071409 RepID=UPI00280B8D89|nr:SAM-dependent methyltransferase [Phytohabitans sp. ZYX-F-186]